MAARALPTPSAFCNAMSPAGQASGQRKARMAMYWAVQSPMPGKACRAASVGSTSAPGCNASRPADTSRASACNAP